MLRSSLLYNLIPRQFPETSLGAPSFPLLAAQPLVRSYSARRASLTRASAIFVSVIIVCLPTSEGGGVPAPGAKGFLIGSIAILLSYIDLRNLIKITHLIKLISDKHKCLYTNPSILRHASSAARCASTFCASAVCKSSSAFTARIRSSSVVCAVASDCRQYQRCNCATDSCRPN